MPTPDRDWELEEWLEQRLSAPVEAAILDRMAAGFDLHTEIYPALLSFLVNHMRGTDANEATDSAIAKAQGKKH